MPAENLSQRKIPAPKQASEAANQRPSKENATAESIVGVRAAGGNGTSSKVGRADALTVAAALNAYEKASIAASECDSIEEARIAFVHSILAAPPVELPAAAPIDGLCEKALAELTMINEALGLDADDDTAEVIEAIERLKAKATAPSPADERAAFEWPMLPLLPEAVITTADGEAVFTAHQMQGYANAYGEMVRARAASANETAAEGAKCLTCNDRGMIGGPSYYAPEEGGEPCPDCSPAMAAEAVAWDFRVISGEVPTDWTRCLSKAHADEMRKPDYAGVMEVRDLFDAPQPPAQTDARVGLTDAVVDAAKTVVREALDSVSVHPCDEHDDEVRARQLPDYMQKLYRALLQGANHAE